MHEIHDLKKNYENLNALTLSLGASSFGVAETKKIKNGIFLPHHGIIDGLEYAVSFAVSLSRKILDTIIDKPNQLYYFHYQRANILIDSISLRINDVIQKSGYNSLPVPASQVTDWENQTGNVSHRHVAYYAGLGWWGKNNLIVNPKYGAGIRLGSVLTDMPLTADTPVENGCEECSICIDTCPAGALNAAGYDKESCTAKLKEFMRTEKIGQLICGVCVKACPVQKKRTENRG